MAVIAVYRIQVGQVIFLFTAGTTNNSYVTLDLNAPSSSEYADIGYCIVLKLFSNASKTELLS